MSEDDARRVHALVLQACEAIDASVAAVLETNATSEESTVYRRAAGTVLMEIFDELLKPLYEQHPAIIPPELDRRYFRHHI